ncbi:MAG: hypothetical protein ONB25_03285 [candidate division KSB1 bacterium]|nr:hypothetical protein [candidate division KSB1 bacterium]
MDVYTIALVAIGVILLGGLVWQLRLTARTGLLFALAALSAVLGLSLWADARRRRLLRALNAREAELAELEQQLEELRKKYAISEEELRQAKEAMRKERAAYMRRILMIDAEKERRTAAIERMSPEEVLEAFTRAYGGSTR